MLAAADVLIQAASGATPSLSPPPRHARRPSASGHENANITSLLQAAAQIGHARPAPESDEASGRGRPTSPLFVPQGTPPHDFPALDMKPEPATPEDTAGEMPDDGEAQALGSLDQLGLVELELQSPIPTASQRDVAAQEEVRNGGIPRSNRRKLEQQCDGVAKVPVAKRLRELYQSAVLVKDRKGRMRRPGGGAVVRRSEM